ncbi:MAG: molybdate ABC transporter substrate-binding protein [Chloroflexi bacterium]|nr:molybdate ABC transporter substrate-binding protein [Chloroflexota bacterium]
MIFLAACAGPASSPKTLTVFAASSTLNAFNEIGKAFEAANPGVAVVFNFDGSQSLRTQLEQGAEADVFASANQSEMDALATQSLISNSQIFLSNELIVILPNGNPANVQTLSDLARPGLSLVLAAEDVPAGNYARQALDNLEASLGPGFKDQVLANLVSEENNVKQVVAKIQLGEADAGIVYNSDAVATPNLQTLAIPAEFNVTARYPIAVMKNAPSRALAEAFVAYVLSPDGQATLKKWGFTPVTP